MLSSDKLRDPFIDEFDQGRPGFFCAPLSIHFRNLLSAPAVVCASLPNYLPEILLATRNIHFIGLLIGQKGLLNNYRVDSGLQSAPKLSMRTRRRDACRESKRLHTALPAPEDLPNHEELYERSCCIGALGISTSFAPSAARSR